jgi:hypothetical protein
VLRSTGVERGEGASAVVGATWGNDVSELHRDDRSCGEVSCSHLGGIEKGGINGEVSCSHLRRNEKGGTAVIGATGRIVALRLHCDKRERCHRMFTEGGVLGVVERGELACMSDKGSVLGVVERGERACSGGACMCDKRERSHKWLNWGLWHSY